MTRTAVPAAAPSADVGEPVDAALHEHLRHEFATRLQLRTRSVTQLYRGVLADSPQVLVVTTNERPLVVMYSARARPFSALAAACNAGAARASLGARAADRVVETLFTGALGGRTYSVHPLLHHTASTCPLWFVQRMALRRAVFGWLREVACSTRAIVVPQDGDRLLLDGLAAVDASPGMPCHVRQRSRQAAARLQHGAWVPSTCLMHGDLWKGNILLKGRGLNPGDFALIDWAGATLHGFPFVDLVCSADSLRAPPAQLLREMEWHASAMECDRQDACGYLLAWTGSLLRKHDAFPEHRIAELACSCLRSLDRAMSAHPGSSPAPGANA